MVFTFHTIDTHKYIGIYSGKDWMDARNRASKESGIPVDNIIPWAYNTYMFKMPDEDEPPHYPYD